MSTTFVPGYLTTVSLNSGDLTVYGNITGVKRAKNVIRKPVFGSAGQRAISGQRTGAFNASGHVAAEGPVAALWAAFESETPIPFSTVAGEGDTAVGTFAGDVVLSSLDITVDAEGEWDWAVAAEIDGDPTFTPAA